MDKRRTFRPKTADELLPKTLTSEFIQDVNTILMDAPDIESQYLRKYWLTKFCELDAQAATKRRLKAIEKWLDTECRNSITNSRLRSSASECWFSDQYTYADVLTKARAIILEVIGPTPSLDILHGGFSGGATTSRNRREGHPALKFLGKADVTRPARDIWFSLIRGTRWAVHWDDAGLEACVVPGNVLFTVPKNADIDRVACKEPDLNIFLQKMIGNQLRWALRRVGINLNDQTINGELARDGSVSGNLATLDLSSASDSVTVELVRMLLPPDWFYYMDLFRSPVTDVDGVSHINEMFSSMGNGYTFELESLIFYALTRATAYRLGVRGKISVYGDDIIAPVDICEPLIRVLSFTGFRVNTEKSFITGPFRESCGHYWHNGLDVKPFYLRGPIHRLSDLILVLNQLCEWASRGLSVVDPRFEAVWLKYAQYIPSQLWGGQDLSSRYSLVSGDAPRKELKPVTKLISHHHIGGLLFWLFVAYERLGFVDDPLSSAGSFPTGLARLRKNPQLFLTTLPLFLSRYSCCV